MRALVLALLLLCAPTAAVVAEEEYLRLRTKVALDADNSDVGVDLHHRYGLANYQEWVQRMGAKLVRLVPQGSVLRDPGTRDEFLATVYYEAARAGIDPQWVLALIQVESAYRKYAISPVGARGFMQVMPFWVELIGNPDDNLFHLRTNLRYGTVILRHYLDIERGNLYRALGRYNGSLGRPEYPNLVLRALRNNWLEEG